MRLERGDGSHLGWVYATGNRQHYADPIRYVRQAEQLLDKGFSRGIQNHSCCAARVLLKPLHSR